MNIIDTRTNFVRIAELLEGAKEFKITLGRFDRNDIGIEALDRGEDVVEIRVAEVGVSLQRVGDTSGRKLERVNSPGEVVVPIYATKRQLLKGE